MLEKTSTALRNTRRKYMDILHYLTKVLKTCTLVSTVSQEDDEEAWLHNRTKGLGGSDIGAICGVNNWATPRSIYIRKTGQFGGDEGFSEDAKERMKFGHILEPIVASQYQERSGKKVAISPATFAHKDYPWALANVDRFIVDDEGTPYGVLECKTAGEFMNEDWKEGDIPISYLYQLTWYMFVTGLHYGAMACLVGGNKFYFYEVIFNEELLETVIFPKADKFWNYHVKQLVEPELHAKDSEAINKLYADVVKNSEIVIQDKNINDVVTKFREAKAQAKAYEKIIDELGNIIKEAMKENEIGYTDDYVIKWSPRSQTRIDSDMLRAKYPEVAAECVKQISFRVLTTK